MCHVQLVSETFADSCDTWLQQIGSSLSALSSEHDDGVNDTLLESLSLLYQDSVYKYIKCNAAMGMMLEFQKPPKSADMLHKTNQFAGWCNRLLQYF